MLLCCDQYCRYGLVRRRLRRRPRVPSGGGLLRGQIYLCHRRDRFHGEGVSRETAKELSENQEDLLINATETRARCRIALVRAHPVTAFRDAAERETPGIEQDRAHRR